MDNKDFEEVEDIFGADLDENYDVPVFEEQASTENNAPVYDVKPEVVEETVDETPTYDIKPEVEETVTPESVVENEEIKEEAPTYGPVPVETVEEDTDEVETASFETNYAELNENPDAVVSLNNSTKEEKEEVKLEDVPPVKLGDNKSLKFVVVIGIIILIAIFFLPYISDFFNLGI